MPPCDLPSEDEVDERDKRGRVEQHERQHRICRPRQWAHFETKQTQESQSIKCKLQQRGHAVKGTREKQRGQQQSEQSERNTQSQQLVTDELKTNGIAAAEHRRHELNQLVV